MKGQTKIELAGKDIPIKFTLGVIEDLKEWGKKHDIEDVDNDPKGQRIMFALMEIYATDKWKDTDVVELAEKESIKYKALGIDQISKMLDMVEEATGKLKGPSQ